MWQCETHTSLSNPQKILTIILKYDLKENESKCKIDTQSTEQHMILECNHCEQLISKCNNSAASLYGWVE